MHLKQEKKQKLNKREREVCVLEMQNKGLRLNFIQTNTTFDDKTNIFFCQNFCDLMNCHHTLH